ncbi:MAG TPA: RidA family protein [Candidatus Acidoferrum sp.]
MPRFGKYERIGYGLFMDDKILKQLGVVAERSEVAVGMSRHRTRKIANQDGSVCSTSEEITTAEAKQAARSVAIELLATLEAAVGDLNALRRIAKLLVFVNSGPQFTEAHVVANGASELFVEVFEERGAHARSTLGVSRIPFGCCVEIEMVVEPFVSESERAL